MGEGTGIAGLPADGSTMVSGLPTAPAEEPPPPDWPLTVVMVAVATLVAFVMVSAQWGDVGSVRTGASAAVTELPRESSEQGSYVEAANFRRALEEIGRRAGSGARVQLMRVDPGQVWIVLDVEGRQRVIRVTGDGVTDDEGGDASSAETRLDAIDPEAPERMLRGLRERFRVAPDDIEYFSLAGWTGTWNAFLVDGTHYAADERGRKLVKVG